MGKYSKFVLVLKNSVKLLVISLFKILFKLIGKLPVQRKVIIFESFLGKQYSCNPRAIYEYFKKHYPDYKMYWSVDRRYLMNFKSEDEDIKCLKRFSLKWFMYFPRAQYWITNSRLPTWIPKPSHTTYLQTWHGTPLKKLALDMKEVHMAETDTKRYKEEFLLESSKWDYLISPNAYSTDIFSHAFQVEKEKILETGYPRNDILYNENNHDAIVSWKLRMGLPLDKGIILYAPTWRDDEFYSKGKYKFDLKLDLDKMRCELGEDYVILLRLHYLVSENLNLQLYDGFAFDYSNYGDISHLYLISDILITDYSSALFDFANLQRPVLFFVYDIENYRDNLRGFYFDFSASAPGPFLKTTDEIINEIKDQGISSLNNQDRLMQFNQKYCELEDGNSSARVVKKLLGRPV